MFLIVCGSWVIVLIGKIRLLFWFGYYLIKRFCFYVIDSVFGSNVVLDFMNLKFV